MQLRQVIKTNQNFVTGERFEQRVLKPVQAARNRVTVQLCDAGTGAVVEEAITENAITPLYESAAYGYIANQLNNGTTKTWSSDTRFSTIVLSDSDINEMEDMFFVHGNVVGLCGRTNSDGAGTHPLRGTYNAAESYGRMESNNLWHYHLVYDWATSAGNGKIQNIYWMPHAQSYSYEAAPVATTGVISTYVSSTGYTFDKRGKLLKITGDTQAYEVLNMLKFINGYESAILRETPEYYTKYEVNGHHHNSVALLSGSGTSFTMRLKITKKDYSGSIIDEWTTEDLIAAIPGLASIRSSGKLGTNCNVYFDKYCDYDGWVGVLAHYSTASSVYKLLPDLISGNLVENYSSSVIVYTMYNVLTKQWLRLPNPWDKWCHRTHWANYTVLRKIDDWHIACNGIYYEKVKVLPGSQDVTSLGKITANWGAPGVDSSIAYTPGSIHPTLPLITDYNGYFGVLRPLTAQTRLAAPITKTSLNTMKIQYDIFFRVPLPYMPPDNVWDLYK